MPVNLSIKNAPDDVVERLRERAKRNHRSLQGELMAIIHDAAQNAQGKPSLGELAARAARLGLTRVDEATALIRKDRDER